ncbi:MAG: SDR family NAD(P)-dependent oxidoreductase [Pseudomonadota bacterium]
MTDLPEAAPKVALLTGANRGIGAAIARRLLAAGWRLSLGVRSGERPAWAPQDAAQVFAYDALAGHEDEWVAAAQIRFGRLDAVIANAGALVEKSVIEAEDADLDAMLEVNVKAPRRLAQSAWEALRATGEGRVVVVASLSGKRVASPKTALYSMSKFAAVALAHGLRQEGWEAGIRATAVCPGLVDTDMARGAFPGAEDMTRPEEVARLVELALTLPNSASVAELHVNCRPGELY